MKLIGALAVGYILDLIIGDPHGLLHPVQIIGWFIHDGKELIWKILYHHDYETMRKRKIKRKKAAERRMGLLLAVVITVGTYIVIWQLLEWANMIHPYVRFGLEAFFIYQILATKGLRKESMKVYAMLKIGRLRAARKRVGYLVGRDTKNLTAEEVAKADVETIAENIADGVIAPMFFAAIGGAPLGFAYKAVNTMDSMIGYRNKENINIGCAAAKLDDLCNLIPSRLAALLMLVSSAILRLDVKNAWKIFKRDRYNHLSPNSAQTEAVAAGALDIQLGGTHLYFGKPVVKPTIGDDIRPVSYEDIKTTNNLLYWSSFFNVLLSAGAIALVTFLINKF